MGWNSDDRRERRPVTRRSLPEGRTAHASRSTSAAAVHCAASEAVARLLHSIALAGLHCTAQVQYCTKLVCSVRVGAGPGAVDAALQLRLRAAGSPPHGGRAGGRPSALCCVAMSGDAEGCSHSHDNLVRVAAQAAAGRRLTRTHGCFAIDGLPRKEPPAGHRDRHYASRELTFEGRPPPTSAALLSEDERSAYDRDGFVACSRPLLSPAEAAHHAALWEACWHEEAVDGNAPGDAVNGYFKKYRGCYDLVSHPRVVQLARDVLGPCVCCWGGHYIAKLPHTDVPVQCHQDGWYWAFTPTRQATVWVALDNVDEGNGAVCFFRGSHRLGLQHRRAGEEAQLYPRLAAACGEPIPVPLPAGHASVHSDLTAHVSAGPNLSGRRRLGIAITYTCSV